MDVFDSLFREFESSKCVAWSMSGHERQFKLYSMGLI